MKLPFYIILFLPSLYASAQSDTLIMELLKPDSSGIFLYNGKPFTGTGVSYFETGEQAFECHFTEGRRNGRQVQWYKNGQMATLGQYKIGETRWCTCKRWLLFFETHLQCGPSKLVSQDAGVWKEWNEDGSLRMKEKHKFHKRICQYPFKYLPL